jgi:hypothetical protein
MKTFFAGGIRFLGAEVNPGRLGIEAKFYLDWARV